VIENVKDLFGAVGCERMVESGGEVEERRADAEDHGADHRRGAVLEGADDEHRQDSHGRHEAHAVADAVGDFLA
jgi:hypothetical protein